MTRAEYALKAQRMLWPLVGTLQEVEDALDAILGMAPEAPEAMLCAHVPPDFVLELEGGLYFALEDHLRPVIAVLRALAVLSRVDVARHQEVIQAQAVSPAPGPVGAATNRPKIPRRFSSGSGGKTCSREPWAGSNAEPALPLIFKSSLALQVHLKQNRS